MEKIVKTFVEYEDKNSATFDFIKGLRDELE